jgi:Secretion system C-terminal sorting domain
MYESSSISFDFTTLVNVSTGFEDMFIAKLDTGFATGLEVVSNVSGLSIFPNPFANELTVRNDQPDAITKLEIYSLDGKKLFEKTAGIAGREEKLNMSQFAAGVYLVKVYTRNDAVTLKAVKSGNR